MILVDIRIDNPVAIYWMLLILIIYLVFSYSGKLIQLFYDDTKIKIDYEDSKKATLNKAVYALLEHEYSDEGVEEGRVGGEWNISKKRFDKLMGYKRFVVRIAYLVPLILAITAIVMLIRLI